MRVRSDNVGATFAEHALTPVSRTTAEGPGQGSRRNLHPDAAIGQSGQEIIMRLDPRQSFRMRQDGREASRRNAEEEIAETRRRGDVRRLDEDIAGVCEREEVTSTQRRDKIRNDVIVGASDELQRNAVSVQLFLKISNRVADIGAGVMIDAREDMRRAGHDGDAVRNPRARHGERDVQSFGPVVDAWQDMTVQIYHMTGIVPTRAPDRNIQVSGRKENDL